MTTQFTIKDKVLRRNIKDLIGPTALAKAAKDIVDLDLIGTTVVTKEGVIVTLPKSIFALCNITPLFKNMEKD